MVIAFGANGAVYLIASRSFIICDDVSLMIVAVGNSSCGWNYKIDSHELFKNYKDFSIPSLQKIEKPCRGSNLPRPQKGQNGGDG